LHCRHYWYGNSYNTLRLIFHLPIGPRISCILSHLVPFTPRSLLGTIARARTDFHSLTTYAKLARIVASSVTSAYHHQTRQCERRLIIWIHAYTFVYIRWAVNSCHIGVTTASCSSPRSSQSWPTNTKISSPYPGMNFGENISPTAAIASILSAYPFSVGLLRELLQNSDDAKASKQVCSRIFRLLGYNRWRWPTRYSCSIPERIPQDPFMIPN